MQEVQLQRTNLRFTEPHNFSSIRKPSVNVI